MGFVTNSNTFSIIKFNIRRTLIIFWQSEITLILQNKYVLVGFTYYTSKFDTMKSYLFLSNISPDTSKGKIGKIFFSLAGA